MRISYKAIMQIGFTYIGTVVGAGFASGQEIFRFVTCFGDKSYLIIAVAVLLFMIVGTKIMLLASRMQTTSYDAFNEYVFGRTAGAWINLTTLLILICITGVMLAGTAALFNQQINGLGVPGVAVTVLILYLVATRGMNAVMAINTIVVPVMLLFSVLIGIATLGSGRVATTFPSSAPDSDLWMLSPFLYAAFNLTLALAVLVPLGSEFEDRRTIIAGGIVGGIGLGVLLWLSDFVLAAHLPQIEGSEIPMAVIVANFGPLAQWLFSLVIFGEIFTTLAGNVFGITRQLRRLFPSSVTERTLIIGLLAICCFISQFGFSALVHHLYPLFGIVGCITLLLMFMKKKPV
ncbi:putative membrane protein YkvI [Aneurinibacillus soli]|uniref:Uncharacterized protein n=1 Tax=Aneurinibacillus soli TaxID=1500254 RepID=A0A0U4WEF3_9BACL|nr:hypothetical protein [Aneurinibacillus soli]PYE62569.1 putative membrane protein YkvI [Aneurinibacillus soli]BAU27131.1 hypothetical protein CB4_01300 [Aneurinibacillus soli]